MPQRRTSRSSRQQPEPWQGRNGSGLVAPPPGPPLAASTACLARRCRQEHLPCLGPHLELWQRRGRCWRRSGGGTVQCGFCLHTSCVGVRDDGSIAAGTPVDEAAPPWRELRRSCRGSSPPGSSLRSARQRRREERRSRRRGGAVAPAGRCIPDVAIVVPSMRQANVALDLCPPEHPDGLRLAATPGSLVRIRGRQVSRPRGELRCHAAQRCPSRCGHVGPVVVDEQGR
jgi:hypothetical protein